MPGNGTSGGFVETLLWRRQEHGSERFGLAVHRDLVYARDHFFPFATRAYIRGPKGISEETLNDTKLPKDPTGEVTTHMWAGDSRAARLFPLMRIEVMWSRRNGIKTVQIEELIEAKNYRNCEVGYIGNRYVHSQWDPHRGAIVHFDGAIRKYTTDEYPERLNGDIKKTTTKASNYLKLFRWDGEIPFSVWQDLVVRFFEQNDLVLEYFGGPDPEHLESFG